MRTRLTLLLGLFIGLFAAEKATAQVLGVNYLMKYNPDSCWYDCFIVINNGSAPGSSPHAIQFNAQYSLVTLAGDSIEIARSYNPRTGPTTPSPWNISGRVKSPSAQPENDFYGVIPTLGGSTPPRYLDGLNPGDTVKLFSVRKVGDPITLCGADIRIYENGADPSSSDPGMGLADFSNGFTIGNPNPLYEGNSQQILGPNPIILSTDLTCSSGIEINLTASTTLCQGPLTYLWSSTGGPGHITYSGTTQDVAVIPAVPANNGLYKVVVTDAIGCADSTEVEGVSKPNAGADQVVCAGTTAFIEGAPNTGTWLNLSNPTGGTRTNVSPGRDQIVYTNTAGGLYRYRYSIGSSGSCNDTVQIRVNPLPALNIVDYSLCLGQTVLSNLVCTTPSASGAWTVVGGSSAVVSIATVNTTTASTTANGLGTAMMRYTRTNYGNGVNCSSDIGPITVNPNPTVVGVQDLCIGGSNTVNPNIGGTWLSSAPGIATVNNFGLVNAIAAGSTTLTYTDANGCVDTEVQNVTAKPIVNISGNDSICVNGTTTLNSSVAGTWASSDNLIAQVSGNTVTGVGAGDVTFILTALSGGCTSDPTDSIRVEPDPVAAILDNRICDETTTTLTPATGGTWVAVPLSVATVVGNTVTAQGNGTAIFTFTNALGCSDDISLTVDPKPTVSADLDTMCVGAINQLFPSSGGGVWAIASGSDPGVISLNNTTKRITGLAAGTAKLLFTEPLPAQCTSDTLTVVIEDRPYADNPETDICIGETLNLTPNTGGVWSSSNNLIATVQNDGTVTPVASGTVTFTFTSTSSNCVSDPTAPLTVNPRPLITVSDASLCIGETLQLTQSGGSGGTWSSSHPLIASISSTGLVTALSAGANVRFTYTDGNSCTSPLSSPIEVKLKPAVNFTGVNPVCINGITSVTSNGAIGTWTSSVPSVAVIDNNGTVTGLTSGTSRLHFIQTDGGCGSDSLTVTVAPKPVVQFTGDTLCIGGSITLAVLPSGSGSWSSINGSVAIINTAGVVTATGAGNTTFRFTSDNGNCPSDNSGPLVVNAPQTISIPQAELCIGGTLTLNPSTGGTWTSVHDTVATVVGALVTGVGEGQTAFNYVDANGCQSTTNTQVTVNPVPIVNINVDNRCVGLTSQASPSTGGAWVSNNPTIASISNTGLITALSPGTATFTYTSTTTLCASNPTEPFTVDPGPSISYTGDSVLCIGEATNLLPNSGGTWAIAPTFSLTVASITNTGDVVALAAGFTRFVFTSGTTGCKSEPSGPLTVNPKPTVFIDGLTTICIGTSTPLFPSTGGTWISNNTGVATVTGSTANGVAEGQATFTFTNTTTTCVSDPTDTLTVSPAPTISIVGESNLCVGGKTELSPNTGGVWTSSAPTIATVNNNGIVSSIAPGIVSFTFQDNIGCGSTSSTAPISIRNCTNPDINATYVNILVPGSVLTNDNVSLTTTYGPSFTLVSKPNGSNPSLVLSPDGSYNFVSASIGVYKYTVPVCVPPTVIGCPVEDLWITVVDNADPVKKPIANVDFATTTVNIAVTLATLANDDCFVVTGCELDPASVTVIDSPGRGTVSINASTGDIEYTPNLGATGIDTLEYRVCVLGEASNCVTARQYITIVSPTAINTTIADDDFAVTAEEIAITGNLSLNDSDPEGDDISVTPQSLTGAWGTLEIEANGDYTFTPAEYFFGPLQFPYTSSDDDATSPASQNATLYILVVPDFYVKVRVYLQGSIADNRYETAPDGRPLMRDDLRKSKWEADTCYIPRKDPAIYNPNDYMVSGLETPLVFDHVVPGGNANVGRFDSVRTDRLGIFDVEGQDALVDWVFIELRSKTSNTTVLSTRSGFVQRDGDVVDLDGVSPLKFPGLPVDDYYVVVRHRSHLGAMTANPMTPKQLNNLVNFTRDSLPVFTFGNGTVPFSKTYRDGAPSNLNVTGRDFSGLSQCDLNEKYGLLGYKGLWGGDFNGNGKVKFDSPFDDVNILVADVLQHESNLLYNANFDFALGYFPGDFDMNGKSKNDNPFDDKNWIYDVVLNFTLNTQFLSNFDFVIEQIP